jgi:Mlc titration factor MtfA (ptsG expression regulator)
VICSGRSEGLSAEELDVLRIFREKRRRRLRELPFPNEWDRWLRTNFPLYARLPEEDRRELHGHIHVFLNEKRFEGCGGLELTDEVRVTIAAQACLLVLHRDTDYFPDLHSILVYPEPYIVEGEEVDETGIVTEFADDRSGETWEQGSLVLAWDEVLEGGMDLDDDFNVVFHEFAHQLDLENGEIDGIPRLESKERYAEWTKTLSNSLERFRKEIRRRKRTPIDPYAAEDMAEFFAVAVEGFFEQPLRLKASYTELYRELSAYFRQDPASWPA